MLFSWKPESFQWPIFSRLIHWVLQLLPVLQHPSGSLCPVTRSLLVQYLEVPLVLCNCVRQQSHCSPQKRLTSVTFWWLKPKLQHWDLRCAWILLHLYFQGFHTSSTLFEPIHCRALRALSMSVVWSFFLDLTVKATFAIHAQEKAISGPCQGTGRKTPLSKWRLVGYRTWCQHVTLTGKPLGPVHTSYCYDFSSACPWVNKLCSFMWMQAESVFYKREVSSTLCCVTHWVCQGKVVPCKADKGTAIGSLRHHDKDGDSESADLCRYCH